MCALVEPETGHKIGRNGVKFALRQADRQQNAVRKSKTWKPEPTAFEPPQPQAVPKEKGIRNAIRRQTGKLKRTTPSNPPTTSYSRAPLFRSDSFDYGDELKRRLTQLHLAPSTTAAPHPRDAQLDAKTQLLNLKAQHKQRRVEHKAAKKSAEQQEKEQRRALSRQIKQEKILEFVRALASRHPRQNFKRIRHGPNPVKDDWSEQQQYDSLPQSYRHSPVSQESPLGTSTLSHQLVSPVASPAPQDQIPQQRYSVSPLGRIPHWSDFSNKDELLAHLSGRQEQQRAILSSPQELPAYERLPCPQQRVQPVEVSTDGPDRDSQMCRSKPNLVYCDICSAIVSLSGVFYSCTICGPREGGIVCSGCHRDNRKCHGGLHDLESSMQVVQRVSPTVTWKSHDPPEKATDVYSKSSDTFEDSAALSRIGADTASHSLCLAKMQKKMTRMEAGIETQTKTTERLASWLEEAMERQREEAANLSKSMLDEFRAERMADRNTIKRLSTKRKPQRQASEGSKHLIPVSRDNLREREIAQRERELNLKEREMSLQERREAADKRAKDSISTTSPLPSQSLALTSTQDNRVLLDVLSRLNRIEGFSAMYFRQPPSFNDEKVDQVSQRGMHQSTSDTSGSRGHAGGKRKAEPTGSIQSTPITGLFSDSFLQPPARVTGRGNQDDEGDEEDGDGQSPKRPKNQPNPGPGSSRKLLLACPYSKLDFNRYSHRNVNELNYRGCSSCVLSDISRLKQHLYRVHQYPEYHCPRCFDDLATKGQLNAHLRDACEPRECPYPEKFSDRTNLKKKWPKKSVTECWYMVFKILFPGHRLPASPYAEDLATGGAGVAVTSSPPQPLPTISLSPEVIGDVVRRQLERRSITDAGQHAFLMSLVQDATTEALGLISALPTPITNSNASSAVPQSGASGISPGPESALSPREHGVDSNLLSANTATSDFDIFQHLQDLSSLGDGVNRDAPISGPSTAATVAPPMSSEQSAASFHGSPLPGPENLMDFDDDVVQLTTDEIMPPIKPSNSTRTVDSGYGSLLQTDEDGVLACDPSIGDDPGLGSSSADHLGPGIDSLLDAETYERLVREHGDAFMPLDWNVPPVELGSGVAAGMGVDVGVFGLS